MVKRQHLANLALFSCFFAFTVIALGAFTRLIDAGLGCPDWPGCYGHWVPTALSNHKAWAEMIHRYFVGGLSGLILLNIIIIFSQKTCRVRSNVILAILLIFLLTYQIILGQWTVTLKLLPIIVSQHLLGGFLILSILWLIYIINHLSHLTIKPLYSLLPWAVLGLIFLFLQIILGAWTSTHYAALSCPDFPFCFNGKMNQVMYFKDAFYSHTQIGLNYDGGLLPPPVRQTIHMVHRIGALFLTSYLLIFLLIAMRYVENSMSLLRSIYVIFGLLFIQLCIGISNVIFKLPLTTAVAHTLVAALLLLAMLSFIVKLIYGKALYDA